MRDFGNKGINSIGQKPRKGIVLSLPFTPSHFLSLLVLFTFHLSPFTLNAQDTVRRLDEVMIQDVRVSNKTPLTTSTLEFMQQGGMPQMPGFGVRTLRADDYPTWTQRRRALVKLLLDIGKEPHLRSTGCLADSEAVVLADSEAATISNTFILGV